MARLKSVPESWEALDAAAAGLVEELQLQPTAQATVFDAPGTTLFELSGKQVLKGLSKIKLGRQGKGDKDAGENGAEEIAQRLLDAGILLPAFFPASAGAPGDMSLSLDEGREYFLRFLPAVAGGTVSPPSRGLPSSASSSSSSSSSAPRQAHGKETSWTQGTWFSVRNQARQAGSGVVMAALDVQGQRRLLPGFAVLNSQDGYLYLFRRDPKADKQSGAPYESISLSGLPECSVHAPAAAAGNRPGHSSSVHLTSPPRHRRGLSSLASPGNASRKSSTASTGSNFGPPPYKFSVSSSGDHRPPRPSVGTAAEDPEKIIPGGHGLEFAAGENRIVEEGTIRLLYLRTVSRGVIRLRLDTGEDQDTVWLEALREAQAKFKSCREYNPELEGSGPGGRLGFTVDGKPEIPLLDIINTPFYREAFADYLRSIFALENLKFLDAVNAYRQSNDNEKRAAIATTIFRQFVKKDSPELVNIDTKTAKELEGRLEQRQYRKNLFEQAYNVIVHLMEKDVYRRFVGTPEYERMKEEGKNIKFVSPPEIELPGKNKKPLPVASSPKGHIYHKRRNSFWIPNIDDWSYLRQTQTQLQEELRRIHGLETEDSLEVSGAEIVDSILALHLSYDRCSGIAIAQRLTDACLLHPIYPESDQLRREIMPVFHDTDLRMYGFGHSPEELPQAYNLTLGQLSDVFSTHSGDREHLKEVVRSNATTTPASHPQSGRRAPGTPSLKPAAPAHTRNFTVDLSPFGKGLGLPGGGVTRSRLGSTSSAGNPPSLVGSGGIFAELGGLGSPVTGAAAGGGFEGPLLLQGLVKYLKVWAVARPEYRLLFLFRSESPKARPFRVLPLFRDRCCVRVRHKEPQLGGGGGGGMFGGMFDGPPSDDEAEENRKAETLFYIQLYGGMMFRVDGESGVETSIVQNPPAVSTGSASVSPAPTGSLSTKSKKGGVGSFFKFGKDKKGKGGKELDIPVPGGPGGAAGYGEGPFSPWPASALEEWPDSARKWNQLVLEVDKKGKHQEWPQLPTGSSSRTPSPGLLESAVSDGSPPSHPTHNWRETLSGGITPKSSRSGGRRPSLSLVESEASPRSVASTPRDAGGLGGSAAVSLTISDRDSSAEPINWLMSRDHHTFSVADEALEESLGIGQRGHTVTLHSESGKAKRRRLFVSDKILLCSRNLKATNLSQKVIDRASAKVKIPLLEATAMWKGKHSLGFSKNRHGRKAEEDACLTLVGDEVHLNLQFSSPETRDLWIGVILDCYTLADRKASQGGEEADRALVDMRDLLSTSITPAGLRASKSVEMESAAQARRRRLDRFLNSDLENSGDDSGDDQVLPPPRKQSLSPPPPKPTSFKNSHRKSKSAVPARDFLPPAPDSEPSSSESSSPSSEEEEESDSPPPPPPAPAESSEESESSDEESSTDASDSGSDSDDVDDVGPPMKRA